NLLKVKPGPLPVRPRVVRAGDGGRRRRARPVEGRRQAPGVAVGPGGQLEEPRALVWIAAEVLGVQLELAREPRLTRVGVGEHLGGAPASRTREQVSEERRPEGFTGASTRRASRCQRPEPTLAEPATSGRAGRRGRRPPPPGPPAPCLGRPSRRALAP